MGRLDPFGRTDQLDQPTLETLAISFEARSQHPLFSRMLHDYVDAMQLEEASKVLDLGCGTGLVAREIARRPGFRGEVIGVDLSPFLVMAAGRLAEAEGLSGQTEFRAGNAHSLEFRAETFDAVIAHTLLSHVRDPMEVLQEAARVLKPGGLLGVFDGDYASLTFGSSDPQKTKKYDEILASSVVTNPRIMRQLAWLLQNAGFSLVSAFPYIMAEAGRANFWDSAIEAYRRLLPHSGAVTAEEADEWADSLYRDSEMGVFFGSCNYYAYVARRL